MDRARRFIPTAIVLPFATLIGLSGSRAATADFSQRPCVAVFASLAPPEAKISRMFAGIPMSSAQQMGFTDKVDLSDARGVKLNQGLITGPQHYRLPEIKANLGLSEEYLATLPPRANILSIGEGLSNLAATLRIRFANTRAVDIWYDQKDLPSQLANFVNMHRSHLIGANSTDVPVKSETVDLVVSHMLLNNLAEVERYKSLDEMIRLIRVGGEARIAFGAGRADDYAGTVSHAYGDAVEVSTRYWRSNWQTGATNRDGQTLTIRRIRSAIKPTLDH